MLCVDYKILAKAIANRVKPLFQKIIHPNQTGFVAGRKIQHNIRYISDTITLAKQKKIEGFLLSLDFEKAFNRVEYRSLLGAMKHFNFGPKMLQWVEMLYSDFRIYNTNNGYSSEPFTPTRGLFPRESLQ